MGTHASFAREGTALVFTGSTSNENPGFASSGGGTPTPSTFEIRWNNTTASLEYRNSPDATWLSLVTFRRYNV